MTANAVICRRCHRMVTIVHPEPGHQFGWCNDCLILYRVNPPDPAKKPEKPPRKKSKAANK